MKNIIALVYLLTFSFYSFAQIGQSDGRQITNGSNFGFFRGEHLPDSFLRSEGKTFNYKDINGTPYVSNKQKLINNIPIGKLYTSKFKLLNSVFIRYNAYSDNIELSYIGDLADYYLLKKKPDSWYVTLGNNTYRAYNYNIENQSKVGFFVIISKNDKAYATLLKKEKVIFMDEVKEKNAFITSSPSRFKKVSDRYYLKMGKAVQMIPKKKKDFLKLFLLKKEVLKKYLDKKKYKLTKEKDLLEIVKYYNSILN